MANTYAWNTGSGDFATPSDWNDVVNGDTVSTVAPGSLDTAYLDPAIAATITGEGSVASLHLGDNAGTLTLIGVLAASEVTLDGGPVAVSGSVATLTSGSAIEVGGPASAVLDVQGGALVAVGTSGPDLLPTIGIGDGAGLNGAVTVDGAGSLLSSGDGAIAVGDGGTGVLSLSDGGTVLTDGLSVGDSPAGGQGLVAVDAAGSLLGSNGQIAIGVEGVANLTISNQGAVDETAILPSGDANVVIGADGGGAGNVLVTLGGVLNAGQGAIAVGMGGSGALTVQQGGTVLSGSAQYGEPEGALVLGWFSFDNPATTGSGVVAVSGSGSLLRAAGAIQDGLYGTGSLAISAAGTVQMAGSLVNGEAAVLLGAVVGSVGTLSVDGNLSLLDAGGGAVVVGNSGSGALSVTNGGTVLASALGYSDIEAAVRIGESAGSTGVLTVANIGSTLTSNGAVWVGAAGSGTLEVDFGGSVAAGGANDGGTGLIVNDGIVRVTGGALSVSDAAVIGAGSLALASGGSVGIAGNLAMLGGTLSMDTTSSFILGPAASGGAIVGEVNIGAGTTLSGAGLVGAGVDSQGTLLASGIGTLEVAGPESGGALAASGGGTLRIDGGLAGSPSVTFGVGGGTLTLGAPGSSFAGSVAFSGLGERIEFAGLTIDGVAVSSPGTVTVTGTAEGQAISYQLTDVSFGVGISDALGFGQDAATGDGYIETACFAAGTCIATQRGAVAVEDLRDGDMTLSPWDERLAVVWRGHRRVACAVHPRPWDVWPVRVRAGAFGEGLPRRDLLLSPDHSVFVAAGGRGALVPVRYLINGASVVQERVPAIDYWHVELPRHGVLLAEGMPAESYLDTGNRGAFSNGGGATLLHPSFAPGVWRAKACAELVRGGPRLAGLRRRLIGRLPDLGFAITDDAALRLEVDGRAVPPAADGGWLLVPMAGAVTLHLRSRAAAPAELDPLSEDRRRLGVPLAGLRIDGDPVGLDDPRLGAGWHAAEPGLRWTAGDAAIDVRGARGVEIALAPGLLRYAVPSRLSSAARLRAAG